MEFDSPSPLQLKQEIKLQITILTAEVTTKTNKTGKPYQALEVNYKNNTFNKVESKQLFSFGVQADAYTSLASAVAGDIFEVDVVKNDKGFNDWVKVKQLPPGSVTQTPVEPVNKTAVAVKSTYETPEERSKKQVYIVRQSCISSAIGLLSVGAKSPLTVESVLSNAQTLYDWVFQSAEMAVKQDVLSFPNDFPDVT